MKQIIYTYDENKPTNKDWLIAALTDNIDDGGASFAESKAAQSGQQNTQHAKEEEGMDGFMNIPEGIDEELPFA